MRRKGVEITFYYPITTSLIDDKSINEVMEKNFGDDAIVQDSLYVDIAIDIALKLSKKLKTHNHKLLEGCISKEKVIYEDDKD